MQSYSMHKQQHATNTTYLCDKYTKDNWRQASYMS